MHRGVRHTVHGLAANRVDPGPSPTGMRALTGGYVEGGAEVYLGAADKGFRECYARGDTGHFARECVTKRGAYGVRQQTTGKEPSRKERGRATPRGRCAGVERDGPEGRELQIPGYVHVVRGAIDRRSVRPSCGPCRSSKQRMAPTISCAGIFRSSPKLRRWEACGASCPSTASTATAAATTPSPKTRVCRLRAQRGGGGVGVAVESRAVLNPERPLTDSAGLPGPSHEGRCEGGTRFGSASERPRSETRVAST